MTLSSLPGVRSGGALLVLAPALIAGCGASRERAPITRAQYIARADAICAAEQTQLAYLASRAPLLGQAPGSPPQLRKAVAVAQTATTRLEALPAPPGEGARLRSWLTARTVAATVAGDAAEAPRGEQAHARAAVLGELVRASALARELARRYGLEVCGAGG
jgi:hypothetical protein